MCTLTIFHFPTCLEHMSDDIQSIPIDDHSVSRAVWMIRTVSILPEIPSFRLIFRLNKGMTRSRR